MTIPNTPPRLAVDAKGYVWRVYEDGAAWSMAPINPDNSPIPHPVTYYESVTDAAEPTDGLREALAKLRAVEALAEEWGKARDHHEAPIVEAARELRAALAAALPPEETS